ncbi:nucleotide-binding universal stress UspA family protein [Streptomyces sp. SLBN-118]|uniref:universal stress protein n=1 Tax=Streptomyces sp. SLBN-118 TaxID=2768454 RepID=UPI0011501A9C|nr:universal stress protein [Streptomyces sp. SLBN-118]TQK50025.1 nucleotide-binding universal stress UspA family protein [Streptomyces sp. SLBN-118]
MLRPVVVGIDGSPESLAAADWAAGEALLRARPLRLVHAWEGMAGDDATLPELQVPRDRARRTLSHAADRLIERHPHLRISADVIARPAPAGLLAEAEAAEVLVLGSRGLRGVGGFLVGSVAQAVVAHARRPVVLVRTGTVTGGDNVPSPDGGASTLTPHGPVVLGIDPSSPCGELIEFAFDEAARRQAPLQAVHAWDFPHASGYAPGPMDAGARAESGAEASRALASALEPWRKKFPAVEVHELVAEGRPVQQLLEAAQGAGLLAVGRRVRPGSMGTHTGRVAHALMHRAGCPVAIVSHD